MPNKQRHFYKNTYHHLYNKSVENQIIFHDEMDYLYFLKKTRKYKDKYILSILCYCLMPNHFHFFVKQLSDELRISKFISDLTNSYTKAFNKKYDRKGVLFQGRTKNKLIDQQVYFIWLIKYILMNPVDAGLVEKSDQWEYSCASDYYGKRNGTLIDKKEIMTNFKSVDEFKSMIEERIGRYQNLPKNIFFD